MKAFFDTNLLFTAAHHPGGKARWLMGGGAGKSIRLLTCTLAVEEARRNLGEKAKPPAGNELEKLLHQLQVLPTPPNGHCPFSLAPKDLPLFWAAQAGGATHFLTGDLAHFGPHMNKPGKTSGILIQTIGEFILSL